MNFPEALTFDDVLMVPQYSDIESRKEIDISTTIGAEREIKLETPIISSPMDTVTEGEMASAISELGGIGIIHRYNTIEQQISILKSANPNKNIVGAAVGVTGDFLERTKELISNGASIICIDVAHGNHILVKKAVEQIGYLSGHFHIMAGNIATAGAYWNLCDWGVDSVRVGIGGGSICSTRINTGHGVPNLHALSSIADERKWRGPDKKWPSIIIDGGIKNAGDIVKALALGADAVMCGSLLAGTTEAPGELLNINGKAVKQYRGMASREAQNNWRGSSSSPEGISTTIPYKGSVKPILEDLIGNIKSGFSYSGSRNLTELRKNAKFVKQTSAGQAESFTHILYRNS